MEKAKGVKWDLSFLYDGTEDPKIEEHLKRGDELANEFVVNYRDKIASSEFNTKMLMEALEAMEKVYSFATRPYHYAMLKFSEDTQNPQNQALLAKVQQSFTVTNNKLVFFNVELMKMPDATADTIMADPEFAHYKHWLAEARKNKPYTLSEKEEQVINLKDSTGKSALVQLYEEYTGDFDFEMEVDGEMKTMTGEEVASYFTSEDPELRKRAYDTFFTVYKDNVKVITSILNNLVRDHANEGGLRKYPSAMTPAYLRDQVDKETIDNLMAVVEKNYDLAQRYYALKKKILGYEKMFGWNRSAPVGREHKMKWDEAREKVTKSYTMFDKEVGEHAKKFFERNWIDAEVRKGKRGGAFCSGTLPDLNPVVLMSFADNVRDTFTLAHEIGHGIHDIYAAQKQGMLTYHPPLCVAETASVFGEMLLTDMMLKDADSDELKRDILCSEIEGVINTCSRQIMYIAFERELHEKGAKQRLDSDALSKMWANHENKIYGETITPHEDQKYFWARVGHFFFARFYCFAYAFGKLFVLALYQRYLEDPDSFKPAYKEMLQSGGQVPPHLLAEKLDMDISSEEFWQSGFDYMKKRIEELEELVG